MPRPGCSLRAFLTPLPQEEAFLVRRKLALLWHIDAVRTLTHESRRYYMVTATPSVYLSEFYFGPRVLNLFEPHDTHSPEAITLASNIIGQENGTLWECQTFFLVSKDSKVKEKVARYVRENQLRKIVVPTDYGELSLSSRRSQFRWIEEYVYAPRAADLPSPLVGADTSLPRVVE